MDVIDKRVIDSWTNTKGKVVIEHPGGVTVLPVGKTLAQWQAEQAVQERRDAGRQAAQAAQTQVAAVERELAKPENRGVFARVDTETGDVAVFVAPLPPGANEPARGASLSPARRRTLELERDANLLIADDDMSSAGARRMAAARAAAIAKLLALPTTPG